jgi:hypothetical protein
VIFEYGRKGMFFLTILCKTALQNTSIGLFVINGHKKQKYMHIFVVS